MVISTMPSVTAKPMGQCAWSLNRLQIGARITVLRMSLPVTVGEISAGESFAEQSHRQDDSVAEHENRSAEDVALPHRSGGAVTNEGREPDAVRSNATPAISPNSTQRAQTPRSPPAREPGSDRMGKDREPHGDKINRALERY